MRSHRARAHQVQRTGRRIARRSSGTVLDVARRAPLPRPVRRMLQDHLLWPTQTRTVPVDRLLLGSQNGLTGAAWAAATGDLLWPSRRVADGPHAQLLRRAAAGPVSDAELLGTAYVAMARECVRLTGDFFGATGDAGILAVIRHRLAAERPAATLPRQSARARPVLAAPVRDSDCFQVIDGHHRVAALAAAGATTVDVLVRRVPESTPLQEMLDRMSWIGGERELYQPVDAPELERDWRTVRRCSDRFAAIQPVLQELGLGPGATHLDVASCYGWFVNAFAGLGLTSEGVERDPIARDLGQLVYGLDPARITADDAEEFLGRRGETWDVVTCFSLLHHFALGRGSVTAAQLVRLLGKATGRVLFLDTGQSHERWFADALPEWDAAYVADFIRVHGGFDEVIDLGPDHDGVPPYTGNYGRHLMAAVRR